MNEILNQMGESVGYIQGQGTVWAIGAILGGALACFLGYKLMRFWIALGGIIIGFVAGYYVAGNYTDSTLIAAIVGILAAIILGMIAYNIYVIGVFLLCGIIGIYLSAVIIQPKTTLLSFVCVAIGVLVAVLSVRFVKPMMIITTSFHGGLLMASGILILAGLQNNAFLAGIGLAIGVFGCIVQFLIARHGEKESDKQL